MLQRQRSHSDVVSAAHRSKEPFIMTTHVQKLDAITTGPSSLLDALTTKVARAAFALPFAVFGLFHFVNANAMAGFVPVPGGVFWVYFTGAALVAGAVGI